MALGDHLDVLRAQGFSEQEILEFAAARGYIDPETGELTDKALALDDEVQAEPEPAPEPEPLMSVPEPEPEAVVEEVPEDVEPPPTIGRLRSTRVPWYAQPSQDLIAVERSGGQLYRRPERPDDPRILTEGIPRIFLPLLHRFESKRQADAAISIIKKLQGKVPKLDQLKDTNPEQFEALVNSIDREVSLNVAEEVPLELAARMTGDVGRALGLIASAGTGVGGLLEDVVGPLVMPETLVGPDPSAPEPDPLWKYPGTDRPEPFVDYLARTPWETGAQQRAFASTAGQMYAMTEADLEKMVAKSEELGALGRLENWQRDVDENVMGMVDIVAFTLGSAVEDGELRQDLADQFALQFKAGQQFGEQMAGGMVGGSAALLRNLPTSLTERPLTTVMMIAPVLKAARRRGYVPDKLGNTIRTADEIATTIVRGTESVAASVPFVASHILRDVVASGKGWSPRAQAGVAAASIRSSLGKMGEAMKAGDSIPVLPIEWSAATQRWLWSSRYQKGLREREIVDRVLREPDQVRAEIEAIMGEISRAVERGDLTAAAVMVEQADLMARTLDELRGELPGAAKAAVPEAAAWEWWRNHKEWADLPVEEVDRLAFGFSGDDVKTLMPDELSVKWVDDDANVKAEIQASGKTDREWADSIDLSEPIDVIFEDGRFKIDDGHHRWNAAKILDVPLKVNVQIADKPHRALVLKAINEGRPVPADVLAQFPDIPPPPAAAAAAPVSPTSAIERYRYFRDEILETAMPGEEVQLLAGELLEEINQAGFDAMSLSERVPLELAAAHLDAVARGVDPAVFGPAHELMSTKVVIPMTVEAGQAIGLSDDAARMAKIYADNPAAMSTAAELATLSPEQIDAAAAAGRMAMSDVEALKNLRSVIVEPGDMPVTLKQADVMAGKEKIQALEAEVMPNLDAPIFAELLDPVVDRIQQTYRPSALIKEEKAPGVRALQEVQEAAGGRQLSRRRAASVVTNILLERSAQHLRDPKHRRRVAERIAAKYPEATRRGIEFKLQELAETTLLDEAVDYRLTVGDRSVSFLDEAFAAFGDLPEKERRRIKGEAMRRTGSVIAADTQRRMMTSAMMDEVERAQALGKVGDVSGYAMNLARSVLIKGEAPPQLLVRFKPKELANQIRREKDVLIPELVESLDVSAVAAEKMLLDFANDFQFGYNAPSPAHAKQLPISSIAAKSVRIGDLIAAGDLPPIVRGVAKGYEESVGWAMTALNFAEAADGFWTRAAHDIKAKLTVHNLPTHKNNWLANISQVGLRRGKTPFGVVADLKASGSLWKQYREGKLTDPQLIADFRAIEQSGLLDTTLIDFELGALDPNERPGPLKLLEEKITGPAYKFGDNIFKLDEALRNMRILREVDTALAPGEWMRLELGRDRTTWLTKNGRGEWMQTETQPKRSPKSNLVLIDKDKQGKYWKKVEPKEVDKLMAEAASKPAKDLFHDYSDVPIWLLALRTSGFAGLVSPFLTWAFKSMDIPGVKRGLVGHLAMGDFQVSPLSNSAAVNARAMESAASASLRRSAVMNGLRANLLTNDANELREALSYMPSDVKTMLVEEATNPYYLRSMNLRSANFAGPTDSLFRVGLNAFYKSAELLDPDWSEDHLWPRDASRKEILDADAIVKKRKVTPEAARDIVKRRKIALRIKGGRLATNEDLLGLIGVGGTPFMDAMAAYKEADARGEEFGAPRAFREFGSLLIGGTPATATSIMLAARDERTAWSKRRWALSDDPLLEEDFTRWAVRSLLGWRWRDINGLKAKEQYADKVGKALKRSLSDDLKKTVEYRKRQIDAATERGDFAAVRELEAGDPFKGERSQQEEEDRLKQLKAWIDDEIERSTADYGKVLERIAERQEKKRGETTVRVRVPGQPGEIRYKRPSP